MDAIRLARSVGGGDTCSVVGAWWLSGSTTSIALPVVYAGVFGAGSASAYWHSSISVSLGGSGVEYWVLLVSTGMLFHDRTYVLQGMVYVKKCKFCQMAFYYLDKLGTILCWFYKFIFFNSMHNWPRRWIYYVRFLLGSGCIYSLRLYCNLGSW